MEKKKHPIKKIVNIFISFIVALLFAFTLLILIVSTINAKTPGKASIFGYNFGIVGSGSMEPLLEKYDFIVYKKYDYDKLKEGDIIVFKYLGPDERMVGQQIVHRIYSINEDGSITTKGDANLSTDEVEVTSDNYYGLYVKHTSLFGIGKLRKNNNIIFVLLISIFILIIVSTLITIYKDIKTAKLEEQSKEIEKEKQKIIDEYNAQKKDE